MSISTVQDARPPAATKTNGFHPHDPISSTTSKNLSSTISSDPTHPINHIPRLCAHFYTLGWVTGTGGGTSIRHDGNIYLAPSGVQKELIKPADIFILPEEHMHAENNTASTSSSRTITAHKTDSNGDTSATIDHSDDQEAAARAKKALKRPDHRTLPYLYRPPSLTPSACTPLFLAAFRLRGARCCIHTHSQWAVLVTLLLEHHHPSPSASTSNDESARWGPYNTFAISHIEQIKGIPSGPGKPHNLSYTSVLRIPVIENTAKEEDLTEALEEAMNDWPDTYAVMVRRHGVYVWGEDVAKAKTICESLDWIWQVAVEMHKLGIGWVREEKGEGVKRKVGEEREEEEERGRKRSRRS